MVRQIAIDKCNAIVSKAYTELFRCCLLNERHNGDLLLCYANGWKGWDNLPCVGPGEDGINNMDAINQIAYEGIGEITEDVDYFKNQGPFLNGTSIISKDIREQHRTYYSIWENTFFLRILTQIVNVLNGDEYDWNLDLSKLKSGEKSKHIRERIIGRLDNSPSFQEVFKKAYCGQIRNAACHAQFNCIQGGIIYRNYQSDKYSNLQGLSFEQWEEIYIHTYLLFRGLFQSLEYVVGLLYQPDSMQTVSNGISVLVPIDNGTKTESRLYPYNHGKIWRFVQPTIK